MQILEQSALTAIPVMCHSTPFGQTGVPEDMDGNNPALGTFNSCQNINHPREKYRLPPVFRQIELPMQRPRVCLPVGTAGTINFTSVDRLQDELEKIRAELRDA
jgi:hypothetical protein